MATETKNTKAFYNTEIPSDWEFKELASIGKVSSGGTPDTTNEIYWNGNINWCTPTDITKLNGSKYIGETIVKITDKGLKSSSATLLPLGSVIVCTRATIGKAAISVEEISTNQGFKNIIPNLKKVDVEFLYYSIINSEHKLLRLGNGSTFLEVPKSDFENFKIPLPPLPEQKAIAQVLSTADAAIHTTEKLIAQKELRKKWLMQQLLTGKKRLKGFDGEWKEVKLSECLSRMANGITYDTEKRTGIPVTRIETISDGVINFNKIGFADSVDNIEDYRLQKGDILYSHINSLSHIGKVAIYDSEEPLYHGMNLLLLRCNEKVNSNFFYQWLVSENGRKKAVSLAKPAVNQASISTTELRKVPISIPTYEEQTAIAQVLQAADKEISLLKAKAEKLREQKKGLMQVLLTGRVRLKINNNK